MQYLKISRGREDLLYIPETRITLLRVTGPGRGIVNYLAPDGKPTYLDLEMGKCKFVAFEAPELSWTN